MNKALAIMELFPNTEPMKDFIVQDDGDERGQYIAMWNIDAPQPTEEELQAAWELIKDAPPPKSPEDLRIQQLTMQSGDLLFRLAQAQIELNNNKSQTALMLFQLATIQGGI